MTCSWSRTCSQQPSGSSPFCYLHRKIALGYLDEPYVSDVSSMTLRSSPSDDRGWKVLEEMYEEDIQRACPSADVPHRHRCCVNKLQPEAGATVSKPQPIVLLAHGELRGLLNPDMSQACRLSLDDLILDEIDGYSGQLTLSQSTDTVRDFLRKAKATCRLRASFPTWF